MRTLEEAEKEIVRLKERIAYLERGQNVIEKADEYAARWAAYEAQVLRLAKALEIERVLNRPPAAVVEAKEPRQTNGEEPPPS